LIDREDMATPELYLSPSLEIHLALEPAAARSVKLTLIYREALLPDDPSGKDFNLVHVPLTLDHFDRAVFDAFDSPFYFDAISGEFGIKPGASPFGLYPFKLLKATTVFPTPLEFTVRVFGRLEAWWFGNNHLTIPRDDLSIGNEKIYHAQASIYAHFDANPMVIDSNDPNRIGTIVDVTGHSYITLRSEDPTFLELSPTLHGWMRGIAIDDQHGNPVAKRLLGRLENGFEQALTVDIINWYGNPTDPANPSTIMDRNGILELLKDGNRDEMDSRHNLLFLSEGFTAAEKGLFEMAVDKIAHELFHADRFYPFPELKQDFNVWRAFTPSAETGVTKQFECRIEESLEVKVDEQGSNALLQATDSFFGLYLPKRSGDNIYESDHLLVGDVRRYPLTHHWFNCIRKFIAALSDQVDETRRWGSYWYTAAVRDGNDESGAPKFTFPYRKDVGMVCMLVRDIPPSFWINSNDGFFVKIRFPPISSIARFVSVPFPIAEAIPDRWRCGKENAVIPAAKFRRAVKGIQKNTTDTIAHELGHSFGLGDEYELGSSQHEDGKPGSLPKDTSDRSDNLTFQKAIRIGNTVPAKIEPHLLRWANLHRIAHATKIEGASWNHLNMNHILLQLTVSSTEGWKVDGRAYVRAHWVHAMGTTSNRGGIEIPKPQYHQLPMPNEPQLAVLENALVTFSEYPTVILEMSKSNLPLSIQPLSDPEIRNWMDHLTLVGGILFSPVETDNNVEKVIQREVMNYMVSHESALTTNYSGNPAAPCGLNEVDGDNAPEIETTVKRKRALSYELVGAHEGGYYATCEVYRPAGFCKMRSVYDSSVIWKKGYKRPTPRFVSRFCYVCQYLIVNRVNPERLPKIDADFYIIPKPKL
jgi:hypothetical protein